MASDPRPKHEGADRPPAVGKSAGVMPAGCVVLGLGVSGLFCVVVYFVVMDPRSFLEKAWMAFFVLGTLVVALGAFLVVRLLRARRTQARRDD